MPATIKAHRASRVTVKKDNKTVAKILAGKQAAFESHLFVAKLAQILAAKQQGLPVKDHVVVKNSMKAKRLAAIRRKQAAQQSMAMSNKAFVGGPTEDEVNEWFEHKREQQEAAECIYQALMAWHKSSNDEQPPLNAFPCHYLMGDCCDLGLLSAFSRRTSKSIFVSLAHGI